MKVATSYIDEIKSLVKAYGAGKIADLLGTTERGVQYWIAEKGPKIPRNETRQKIHELFIKHQNGLQLQMHGDPNQNELLELLRDKNIRLEKEVISNLNELNRRTEAMGQILKAMMEVLVVQASDRKAVYRQSVEILKKYGLEDTYL